MTSPNRTRPMISALLLSALLVASTVTLAACNNTPPRADAEINREIQTRVSSDQALQSRQIEVETANGVVTLSGMVPSEAQRRVAAADAASVEGVRTVVNNLTVASMQAEAMPAAAAPPKSAPPRVAKRAPQPAAKPSARQQQKSEASVRWNTPPPTPAQRPAEVRHASYDAAPAPSAMAQRSQPARREIAQVREPDYAEPEPEYATPAEPDYEDPPPPPPSAKNFAYVRIPAGTPVPIRMLDPVSSETALPGDTFRATVNFPVEVNGEIVIPVGADVLGRVTDSQSAGKFKGSGFLAVELMRVSYNGHSYVIHTDQWSRQTEGRGKNTATKVGGGAALGAIIGGLAGGGKGAGIGALVGAGAGGTAQAVTHGKQIELEPEAQITFRLSQPVTVSPSAVNRRNANRPALN